MWNLPTAILSKCPENFSKKDASTNARGSCNSEHTDGENMETARSFMPEEEQLFLRRFEESFNLPDLRYVSWFRLNQPELNFSIFPTELSLIDFFPETTPLNAIAVCAR